MNLDYDISNHIEQHSLTTIGTTALSSSSSSWSIKSPEQWQPIEVAEWIRFWASRNNIQDIEIAHLLYNQMSGHELCQMQREYFTNICPQYGNLIYDSLQSLMEQFRHSNLNAQQQQSNDNKNCFLVTNSNSDYAQQQHQQNLHHDESLQTNDISNHHHHLLPIHLDLYHHHQHHHHSSMINTNLDSTIRLAISNDDLFDDNNNNQQQPQSSQQTNHHIQNQFNHHHHHHHQLNHYNNNTFEDPSPNSYGKSNRK